MKKKRAVLAALTAALYVGTVWLAMGGESGPASEFGAVLIVTSILVSGFIGQAFRVRDERTSSLTSGSAIAVAILGVVFITAFAVGFMSLLASGEGEDDDWEPAGITPTLVLMTSLTCAVLISTVLAVLPNENFGLGDGDHGGVGGWGGWESDGGCDGGGDGGD